MDPRDLVQRDADASLRQDYDAMAGLYTDDVRFIDAQGEIIEGRHAFLEYLRRENESFPCLGFDQEVVAAEGDRVVTMWTFRAKHDRDLLLPSGETLPATGREILIRGVNVCRIRDGRFSEIARYYDRLSTMVQLGLR